MTSLLNIVNFALLLHQSHARLNLTGEEAAQLVRDEFRYAYQSYLTYAYGYDELRPLWFNGSNWYEFTQLLTPIDSLSTLALMGDQQDLINITLQLVCNFKWQSINTYINMFELIIRDVGGLLSAYWFLGEECLKDLAIDLGQRIWNSAFSQQNSFSCRNNENGDPIAQIPWNFINLATGQVRREDSSQDMAAYTTNLVEFGILSYISGDIRYYQAAKDIMQQIMDLSSDLNLPGRKFDVMAADITNLTQLWPDQGSHINAGIDSYFEYMIKCYELFGDEDCLRWWNISYAAILEYMSYYTEDDINEERLWFKRVMMQTGEDAWDVGHYDLHAHFFALALALSGDMENAKKNQEANHYMWSVLNSKVTPFNYDFIQNTIIQPWWDLNPEVMESNYYLYAITGEQMYFDRALEYLEDIMDVCRCDDIICTGYSALENVNASNIIRKPRCQSFFYAETYKYLYLTFVANTSNGNDIFNFNDYIFNTEAQPLPKEWGSQLLAMMNDDNNVLPDNYNNCQRQRQSDTSMSWIVIVIIIGCVMIMIEMAIFSYCDYKKQINQYDNDMDPLLDTSDLKLP